MAITIYHNPACGTSRNTLEMLRQSGEFGGGPSAFSKVDRSRFLSKLDEMLHAIRRGRP